MTELLDPRNDVVFKMLFVRRTDLLVDLINSVREHCPPIRELTIHNPAITPDEPHSKFIVLDICATDSEGFQFDIEMQVRRDISYGARSAYYLAKLLTGQLEQGRGYGKLRPAIGIHLLNFTMFPDARQSNYHFAMRDGRDPTILLGPELQLYVLELRKMEGDATLGAALRDWVFFFEHAREDEVMRTIEHPPVREALSYLAQLSAEDEARRLAFVRERALRDEVTALENARREGREEGRRHEAGLVLRQLHRRFGPLPLAQERGIEALSSADLGELGEELLDFASAADLSAWLDSRKGAVAGDM